MRRFVSIVLLLAAVIPAFAQQRPAAENPLAQLKDEVKRVLAEAQLPFTESQESAIVLMMEDRRKASEDLFGNLMDFSAGPTQGQEADRLRSAIEWMRQEFLSRLKDYLTPEQLTAWGRSQEASVEAGTAASERPAENRQRQQQTQYVRINNNAFTAEESTYRYGRGGGQAQQATEVIQRGGAGAFHGNAQLLLKDESLNARNPFASNKPPYQERQSSFDVSGPLIPGRLTTSFSANQNEAENVDTIHATLPEGVFALGITKPTVTRSFKMGNTFQLWDAHSLSVNLGYATNASKNQGVGGFVMPERASTAKGRDWNIELKQFSSFSPRTIYETRFNFTSSTDKTIPVTEGLRINVLDTFSRGGAQNATDTTARTYEFSNMYSRLGEKLTLKAGTDGVYRSNHSLSTSSFGGTFTFSSLDSYLAGRPLNYRVTRGDPLLEINQLELSFFIQNDVKITPRLMLMFGGRYDIQTNLSDHNNFGPRMSLAYGLGQATVLRAGAGLFYHQRLGLNLVELQQRQNGTRQVEIVVDNPSFPDPFQTGTVRNTLPAIRVTDPLIEAPYLFAAMASYERTFFTNLLFSVTYDYYSEQHRFRGRDLNAPYDLTSTVVRSCRPEQNADTCARPDPTHSNIFNLETTSNEIRHSLRFSFRQRFSIFNVTANYKLEKMYADATPAGAGTAVPYLPQDSYNLGADWSRAGPYQLHTLSTTLNARLPMGMFLTGTMNTNSHKVYTITTGKDDNRDGIINDRPLGLQRNTGTGANFLSFAFNVSKAFFFGAADSARGGGRTRTNINLFANMTNAFNHLNLGPPSGVMTSPNFGKSTSAVDPREIEIGLRFQF